jgi:hypothetical protein
MKPLRVFIADESGTLDALVHRAIADEPDVIAIGHGDNDVEIMLRAEEADVVVIQMNDGHIPPLAERLIDEYADLGVIAVNLDRNSAVIIKLQPQLTEISDISRPTALTAAIRRAATRLSPLI